MIYSYAYIAVGRRIFVLFLFFGKICIMGETMYPTGDVSLVILMN